ncbi:MAG: hypothetical protein HY683_09905 [Chloroflexi bacterium]|nr:hypothetical protein [Chloroflexota bacterium]
MMFHELWSQLERRFQAEAAREGSVYLPNLVPNGPAEYVFIAMEPSLGRWAKFPDEAKRMISLRFKNFCWSKEDFALHFAIRTFLCTNGESYHLTDLSKGAMLTAEARLGQMERYRRWYPLLRDELQAISGPDTKIFAIGRRVRDFLSGQESAPAVSMLLHYSQQAARYRSIYVDSEDSFRRFKASFRRQQYDEVVDDVLKRADMAQKIQEPIRERILRSKVNPSLLQLVYGYKCVFDKTLSG